MLRVADTDTTRETRQVAQAFGDIRSSRALSADVVILNAETTDEATTLSSLATTVESTTSLARKQLQAVFQIQIDAARLEARVATLSRNILTHLKSLSLVKSDLRQIRQAIISFDKKLHLLTSRFLTASARRRRS
jgi:hypothetical protein